jgi:tetratricopeptide (TPR) repeat protein
MLLMLQQCVPQPDPRSEENGRLELGLYLAQHPNPTITWDRLVAEHWIRVVWNRWDISIELRSVPDADQEADGKDLVLALIHLRQVALKRRVFHILNAEELVEKHKSAHAATPSIEALIADGVLAWNEDVLTLVPHSSVFHGSGEWIAARLWDREEAGPSGLDRLAWWRDRVFGLGVEWFDFGDHLDDKSQKDFLELAWRQILSENDLLDWEQERARFAAQVALAFGLGTLKRGLTAISPVPVRNPIAQFQWLEHDGLVNSRHEERRDIAALLSVLFRWRTGAQRLGPWDAWIEQLADAAAERPYLVYEMELWIRRDPAVAADFLLVPKATTFGLGALASRLKFTPSAWEPHVGAENDRAAEKSVWRDIAECAAWALFRLDAAESGLLVAALLERFAGLARSSHSVNPSRVAIFRDRYAVLRDVLAHWPASGGNEGLAFDSVGEGVVVALKSSLDAAEIPVETPAFEVLMWLASIGADEKTPWRPFAIRTAVDSYCRSLNDSTNWYRDASIEVPVWTRVAGWLVERDNDLWTRLVRPANFAAAEEAILHLEDKDQYGARYSLLHRIRSHALLLLGLAGGWAEVQPGKAVPELLESGIAELLAYWLPAEKIVGRPSIVDANIDIELFFEQPRESLLLAIGKGLPRLSQKGRTLVLDCVLSAMTEVRQLAIFVKALDDGPDKDAAKGRLRTLPMSAGKDDVGNIVEVERSVDALLDVGEFERAEVWLEKWAKVARQRHLQGWARWEVTARQRIRLARKQFVEAADAEVPDSARGDIEAENSNDFFRGIALLSTDPPRSQEAIEIYERLAQRSPQEPSCAVNLLAARTQWLTFGKGDAEPTAEEANAIRDLLALGESLMTNFSVEQRDKIEQTYQANRLRLFWRLRDWKSLLGAYQALSSGLQRDPTLVSFVAEALEVSGQKALAASLRAEVGSPDETPARTQRIEYSNPVEAAREAIRRVPEFGIPDQGQAWWGKDVREAVTDAAVATCQALADIAPALAQPPNGAPPEEDRVTKLLAELLRQRFLKLCWNVASQQHGGYTEKDPAKGRGGIGERDLEILAGSAHVAVGEAVLVLNFDTAKLAEHFRRLFKYAPAGVPIMLFLIWSYAPDPAKIWGKFCTQIAETQAPDKFKFLQWMSPDRGPESGVWHRVSELLT